MSESRPNPGWYKCRGVAGSAVLSQSSKAHSDQVELMVFIPQLGAQYRTTLSFSGKAQPYSIEKLFALGWTGSTSVAFEGIDANEIDCEIRYEMYNDKEQMRVELSSLGGGAEPMAPKLQSAFMNRIADLAKRTPRPAGQRIQQPQHGSGGGGNGYEGEGINID